MQINNKIRLVVSVLLSVALGSLGGLFTLSEIPVWYAGLQKPSFNPPNWIFGPVWTVLYFLMGVSFYLVWKENKSSERNRAMGWFGVQFLLNFCWSMIFFHFHQTGWAMVEIIFMWVAILITLLQFGKISSLAAWLLVPYISWVSFASVLNYAIWQLNH